MSGQVRPFRKYSVPQLVEMVVKWRGETKVLVELVTELEFRQGKIARSIQATLTEELKTADWDRSWEQHGRWDQCKSLGHVLNNAERRLWTGVELLRAAGYPIMWRAQAPAETRNPVRRAIAWNDGGRLTTETGTPGSVERCRLLIDVFTRAITLVRREGLARGGAAEDIWPHDRRVAVKAMQRVMKEARQGVERE